MTQPGLERSLHATVLPPGPLHIHGVQSTLFRSNVEVADWAAMKSSIPLDYLCKVSGTANISDTYLQRYPFPTINAASQKLRIRILRLSCLTTDFGPLWSEVFDPSWQTDGWTDPALDRSALNDIEPDWSMATPLRRDRDRWQALVEIDALAALMLGLTAEQLCAMYRTQFAVLRKYEYKMVFDAEGRKICGYHQSAGFRQSQLQDQAKAGDLPAEWKNLWNLYEQYEADPATVDWLGHYTEPFIRVDREAAMTRAYNEFQRRLDEEKNVEI